MTTAIEISVEERILQLLGHLGIQQAHFAAQDIDELSGLVTSHPDRFASLTLVCPPLPSHAALESIAARLLVFRGDLAGFNRMSRVIESLPGATLKTLSGYVLWFDLIARYTDEFRTAILAHLVANPVAARQQPRLPDGAEGEIAGITYRIQGSGPPLLLFPLGLNPSQWEPILPALAEKFTTIILGGTVLGMAGLLEKRALTAGYLGMVCYLMEEANLQSGDAVLDVGCGTGAISRWLARYTEGQSAITGVDINRYLLREARNLVLKEGLAQIVRMEEGNGEALPYPDNSFDLVLSLTVMEEVDADRVLAEMIRVARPGGRIAVSVRAKDMPFFLNMPLGQPLKAQLEHPRVHGGSAGPGGCADASLYRRFQETGLTEIKIFPHLVSFVEPWALNYLQEVVMPMLDQAEVETWRIARAQAEAEGSFVWSHPHHCAVGTKPL